MLLTDGRRFTFYGYALNGSYLLVSFVGKERRCISGLRLYGACYECPEGMQFRKMLAFHK